MEILEPRLSKADARPLIASARRHWKTGQRAALLLAVELRRLQDGEAHLTYSYDNFGEFAAHKFDGLSAAMAQQLSRQGSVLLALERHGRLSLADHRLPIGTLGSRALAGVLNQQGEQAMLKVFDRARKAQPARALSDVTVKRVMRELDPPMPRHPPFVPSRPDEEEPNDDYGGDYREEPEDIAALVLEMAENVDGWPGPSPEARQHALDAIAFLEARLAAWKERA